MFVVHLCGPGLRLSSAQNKDDCLSYSPGNKDKEEFWVSSQVHFGLQESILVKETISILVELQLLNGRNDMHPKHQDYVTEVC